MEDANKIALKRLILPMFVVFCIALTALVVLYERADPKQRPDFEFEAAKAALTVMVGVLITGVVALIVKSYEAQMKELAEEQQRQRKKLAEEQQIQRRKTIEQEELRRKRHQLLRTDLLDGVATLYYKAKSVRRRLRASVSTDGQIDATKYDELLQELNETQLGLERFVAQAKNGADQNVVPKDVPEKLGSMESYLGKLVSEYEDSAIAGETLAVNRMDKLQDLIGPYRPSHFRSEFVHPYRDASSAVAMADQQSTPLTSA
jgi:hypothetical protein